MENEYAVFAYYKDGGQKAYAMDCIKAWVMLWQKLQLSVQLRGAGDENNGVLNGC